MMIAMLTGLTARITVLLGLVAVVGEVLIAPVPTHAASPERNARHTDPKSLVLHVHDLPASLGHGFTESGAVVSNDLVAGVEHVSQATMNRYRISGYQTSFGRRAKQGVITLTDSVGLYRSDSAAHWQYKLFTSQNKPRAPSTKLRTQGVGNEAVGYITSSAFLSSASLYWRRGIYTARIDILANGLLRASDALTLAHLLDGRMKRAR